MKYKTRGYTKEKALINGIKRENNPNYKTNHYPECGCP